MNKKSFALLVILVVVVGAVVAGLIYDRNEALIDRTQPLPLGDNYQIVEMHKHGFIFHRAAYEAKIKIPHDEPETIMNYLANMHQFGGEILLYTEYLTFRDEVFTDSNLMQPQVEEGSNIWLQGVGEEGGPNVVNIIVSEDSENAYLYVYYHA